MTKPLGRPRLPRLDRAAIDTAEQGAVATILSRFDDRLERLTAAAQIADEAQAAADTGRASRDRYALSLSVHEGVRGLSAVLGISRTRWTKMSSGVTGVRHVASAARKLPPLAESVARNEARAAAARTARNQIVVELYDEGMARAEVAELIGRNPSRVSHIRREATAAAGT